MKRPEESKESIVRKVYEKQKLDEKVLSKDKAIKLGLLNSKNPNADYNNPNNPNYKGRLTNKIIESFSGTGPPRAERVVPKSKGKPQIFKEREDLQSIDDYDRRDQERDQARKKYGEAYAGYFHDELQVQDYAYADDKYADDIKVNYRRSDYYEDERERYRPYPDDRERYSRFN